MRHILIGACSVVLLTACGDAVGSGATASGPAPSTTDRRADTAAGGEGTTRCDHPAGFSVAQPSGWAVNPGEVLPVCSWFAADPFTVPEASGVRLADITLMVQDHLDLFPVLPDETARTSVEVGGRPAVRVEQVAGPGFWPEGTPVTSYLIDLGPPGADGDELVADTVGLPGTDYDRNVAVLDAMMESLVLGDVERL